MVQTRRKKYKVAVKRAEPAKSKRVCKQFKAITETSPILQEEMMLRPRGEPRQCWRLENRDWVTDPFERGRWAVHQDGDEILKGGYRFPGLGGIRASLWTPARLCPLLSVNSGWHQQAQTKPAFRVGNQRGEHVRFECKPTSMSHTGSWRNVLVTDPPCFKAVVTLRFTIGHYGIPDGTLHLQRKVENAEGLRFGDLILEVLRMPGWVSWSMHGRQYHRVYQRPDKRFAKMEEQLGVKALLDTGHGQAASWTRVWLKSVVIPAEEEWTTVK